MSFPLATIPLLGWWVLFAALPFLLLPIGIALCHRDTWIGLVIIGVLLWLAYW